MTQENTEALQWFVDFANLDLENLKPGDKAKFFVEAKQYLWPTSERMKSEYKDLEEYPSSGIPLVSPDVVREMAWASEPLPPEDSTNYWQLFKSAQHAVTTTLQPFAQRDPNDDTGLQFCGQEARISVWMRERLDNDGFFRVSYEPIAKSYKDYVHFKICNLMNGFSYLAVRKCPGCGKFFLNPTRRKKEFCGNRCMWRVITSKKRAEEREKYNKYQAQLMRDRYREKKGHKRLKTKSRKKEG